MAKKEEKFKNDELILLTSSSYYVIITMKTDIDIRRYRKRPRLSI
jgi:hypothetical protein